MKAAKFAGAKAFIIKQRENGMPVAEICDQSARTALPCIARLEIALQIGVGAGDAALLTARKLVQGKSTISR